MEEMAPNALQEAGFGIPSHYMILYYTQLTYIILSGARLAIHSAGF